MKQENKDELKKDLDNHLGRPANPNEVINMETDALLLVKMLIKKVENLEERIIKLEK